MGNGEKYVWCAKEQTLLVMTDARKGHENLPFTD